MLVGCGPTVGKMNDGTVTRALPSAEDLQAETEGWLE